MTPSHHHLPPGRRPRDEHGERRRHHHPLGGPEGHGRPGRGRRGGRRGPRGDVRAAVLLLLDDQPMHGYQLIQEIAERSDGAWTPSPGSIYPVLQQLEDEGLVEFERIEGRKTATLTEAGRTTVAASRDTLGTPWDDVSRGVSSESRALKEALGALLGAVRQMFAVGSTAQQTRAIAIIDGARKDLYRLLADDEPTA